MKTIVRLCIILSVALFASGSVFSAGFSIFEQGATATGMAGAITATADNPTAVFYNPAGITELEGTQLSLGATIITVDSELTDPFGQKWDADSQVFYPPNFYLTHRLNDRFALGLGMGVPFGLGMKWDNNESFIYRYLITEVNVSAYYLNPVVSYRINDHFSIGGGPIYVISDVDYAADIDMTELSQALSAQLNTVVDLPDGHLVLDGDNENGDYGFNIGLQGRFEKLKLGLTYKSSVDCAYDGWADFTVTPTGYGDWMDAIVDSYFPDSPGGTSIEMPAFASVGVAYQFTEKLLMEFDINWMEWSTYDSLVIDFENEAIPDKAQPKNWDDVFSYRLGARYQITDMYEIYAGYLFDESPIPDNTLDPILPDADRHSVQLGLGYTINDLKLTATYMALFFKDRETNSNILNINGDYESYSNLIGLQLSYVF